MIPSRAGAALASAVLITAAALYWLPSHVAAALGWGERALGAVVDRIEMAGLWLALAGVVAVAAPWARQAAVVMLWPAAEAAMGAAARLSLPMLRLQLWQRHQQLKRALRLAWLRHRSTDLALPDRSMLQRHRPKRSWLLSLRWLPLWRQWPHWLLPWPSWPLSRLSLFRWQLRKLLRRCQLYL